MDEQKKYPRFLSNDPCGEDLFEGHSHRNIAQSIASLLKSNDQNHVIGIEGGWGSGKSNMVKLVQKELEQDNVNQFHFFIYDAWEHQTDTLRRSILEELTVFLVGDDSHNEVTKGIMDHSGKWKEWKNHLLSKRRHIKQKTVKELNPFLVVGAFFAPFIPVFNSISHFITSDIGSLIYWFSILILVFSIAIVIYKKQMKKYEQKFEFKKALKELFKLYLDYKNKDNDDKNVEALEKHTTIYEEETSSRDFRFWVNEINNDLGKKDLKLVIVFDNMDRLPKDKVQELWAVIHTLFAEKNFSNIHVIVPFDREHMQSAFRGEDIIDPNSSNNTESQKKKQSFGDDYINKTFDVVYRVAPPIMSDWKSYFESKWEEAFGEKEKPGDDVIQIIDSLMGNPSPRELIAFINEFVSIRQSLQEDIPDKYIAIYIFGKSYIIKNLFGEIASPTYLKGLSYLYEGDTDLPIYISMLHFQIPSKSALDIAYISKLRKALDEGDLKTAEGIMKLPSSELILDRALDEVTNFPAVINLLEALGFNNQKYWDHFYQTYKVRHQPETILDDHLIKLLWYISKKEEYVRQLINELSESDRYSIDDYCSSIDTINSHLERYNLSIHHLLPAKSIEPSDFILFVTVKGERYIDYRVECKNEELDKYLSELTISQLKDIDVVPILTEYNHREFTSYIAHLEDLVHLASNLNELTVIYRRLKEVQSLIKVLPADDVLFENLKNCNSSEPLFYDLGCMMMVRTESLEKPEISFDYSSLKSNNSSFYDKVSSSIIYYMNYCDILLCSLRHPEMKNVAITVTNLLNHNSHSDRNERYRIFSVLKEYDKIKNTLEVDSNIMVTILNRIVSTVNLIREITPENVMQIPISFCEDNKSLHSNLTNHYRSMCIEYLSSLPQEQLEKELSEKDSDTYKYAKLLRDDVRDVAARDKKHDNKFIEFENIISKVE